MAGTITSTENTYGVVKQVIFDWLSHTDGSASATATTGVYNGQILNVMLVPDGSTTAPSDQYDITLTDGTYDLLFGQGANCSATETVVLTTNLGCVANSKLYLTVANAGSAKGGLVLVYVR